MNWCYRLDRNFEVLLANENLQTYVLISVLKNKDVKDFTFVACVSSCFVTITLKHVETNGGVNLLTNNAKCIYGT